MECQISNKKGNYGQNFVFQNNNQVFLNIKDNGHGFDKSVISKNSIGMDILDGLVEQINGTCKLTSDKNGTNYKISFSKK